MNYQDHVLRAVEERLVLLSEDLRSLGITVHRVALAEEAPSVLVIELSRGGVTWQEEYDISGTGLLEDWDGNPMKPVDAASMVYCNLIDV